MVFRPEVFLSATPGELDAYREAVRKTLREMGVRVVENQDFSVSYGPLQGVLYQLITRCELVIHLAGSKYGIEPPDRTLGAPRRSVSQYEVDVARAGGKPIFAFIAAPNAPVGTSAPEPDELRQIQREHCSALRKGADVIAEFANPDELVRKLRELRARIVIRRHLLRLPFSPLGNAFVGRLQVMEHVRAALSSPGIVVLHPTQDAYAETGTGRTALAYEIGNRLYHEGVYPYVFALPGGPKPEFEAALAGLARSDALGLLPDEVAGHRARLKAVLEWFNRDENRGRWLIIIDGVHDAIRWQRIREVLPKLGDGAVLVTSRMRTWPDAKAFAIGAWGSEQARGYLFAKTMPGRAQSRSDLAAADRLIDGVGRMPLGVEVLTKCLAEEKKTPLQFVTEVLVPMDLTRGPTAGLAAVSFRDILQRTIGGLDPFTRALLAQLLCFAPQPSSIPLVLFEQRGDWQQIRTSLGILERRALIEMGEHARSVSVHRGIREILLSKLNSPEYSAALASALSNLDAALRRETTRAGAQRDALIPHCRILLEQLVGTPQEANAAPIAAAFGDWLEDLGRPAEATPYFRRALAIEERRSGPQHADTGARLRDLAAVTRARGRPREAERYSRRALAISERIHGLSHAEVVADLYQVAGCLRAANYLSAAEPLYRRALQVEESAAGRSHPRVAISLQRLAGLLEVAHHSIEAEACYRRAITIDEQAFGQNHPRVITGLYNLASVLIAERRWDQAEDLLRRALARDEHSYGTDHIELAPALKLQVNILEHREAWSEAEALLQRILAIEESALGPGHIEVAADCLAIASIMLEEWRPEEARPYVERGVSILVAIGKRLRRPHPHLPTALQLLEDITRAAGFSEEQIEENRLRLLGGIQPPRVHARI